MAPWSTAKRRGLILLILGSAVANANGFLRNKSASSHLRFATGEQVYTGYTARFEKGIVPSTLKLMNTHELFCISMSSVSEYERLYIMAAVQKNHLAEYPDDKSALFSAADVAIIPPGTDYKKRRNALGQSQRLLSNMTGCVDVVETDDGERFFHSRSPVREGLHICDGCIFHEGTIHGTVPLLCPDNLLARKVATIQKPSIQTVSNSHLRQLKLP